RSQGAYPLFLYGKVPQRQSPVHGMWCRGSRPLAAFQLAQERVHRPVQVAAEDLAVADHAPAVEYEDVGPALHPPLPGDRPFGAAVPPAAPGDVLPGNHGRERFPVVVTVDAQEGERSALQALYER